MKLPKYFLWALLVCLVGMIAYTIGKQGAVIEHVKVGPDGVDIRFHDLGKVPKNELEQRQQELRKSLDSINASLKPVKPADNTATSENTAASSTANDGSFQPQPHKRSMNLNGNWQSNVGMYYQIYQYGNAVSIREVSPAYGVTAVGNGQIYAGVITLSYRTVLNTFGNGVLNISPDGRTINGQFADQVTGVTSSVILYR